MEEKELKETLQSIADTLKRIEKILLIIEKNQGKISDEEFYKMHGINQTYA